MIMEILGTIALYVFFLFLISALIYAFVLVYVILRFDYMLLTGKIDTRRFRRGKNIIE